eukprot:6200916-Pleurochrysis_carterae.AAC.1
MAYGEFQLGLPVVYAGCSSVAHMRLEGTCHITHRAIQTATLKPLTVRIKNTQLPHIARQHQHHHQRTAALT